VNASIVAAGWHARLLIVEILLQNTGIVRFGKCKHQENARFLRVKVVGEHASNFL